MGSLKPGVKYVYERQGGTVYAREFGAAAEDRFEIGYDWELDNNPSRARGATRQDIQENQLWHNIRMAAKENKNLQEALDRVKILYELSKKDGKK